MRSEKPKPSVEPMLTTPGNLDKADNWLADISTLTAPASGGID